MPRTARRTPHELTPGWPDTPSPEPSAEVARRLALALRAAIGDRSVRGAAAEAGLHHATLLGILEGRSWPDLETIAKLERGLDAELWPGRAS